jgi:flagellar biogenesis protein FliO
MSSKIIASRLPNFAEGPPIAQHIRNAVRWLLKRFSSVAPTTERVLTVEDRVAIGLKKSLVVVRCHGQRFLIATSGDTIGPVLKIAPPKAIRRASREHEA